MCKANTETCTQQLLIPGAPLTQPSTVPHLLEQTTLGNAPSPHSPTFSSPLVYYAWDMILSKFDMVVALNKASVSKPPSLAIILILLHGLCTFPLATSPSILPYTTTSERIGGHVCSSVSIQYHTPKPLALPLSCVKLKNKTQGPVNWGGERIWMR